MASPLFIDPGRIRLEQPTSQEFAEKLTRPGEKDPPAQRLMRGQRERTENCSSLSSVFSCDAPVSFSRTLPMMPAFSKRCRLVLVQRLRPLGANIVPAQP